MRWAAPVVLALTLALGGCGGGPESGAGGAGGGSGTGGGGAGSGGAGGSAGQGGGGGGGMGGAGGASGAAALAQRLRGRADFLIGLGNDLAANHDQDGAYTLGVTLDLHYAYLVGLPGAGGWPDWNANGSFVNILADSADAHGVTPMYTLYMMAAWGDGNLAGLTDDAFMRPYWDAARLLFERLALFGRPALVHLEPDFWAYAQQQTAQSHGGDPGQMPVHVAIAPDCADLPDSLVGMGQCLVRLGRTYAPEAAIGFHASVWAGAPADTVAFLRAVGAAQADCVVVDTLDRDAGCFEAHTDPACQRGGTTGWTWDETNQTSPNFAEHLAWAQQMHQGLALPVLWWQTPLGVPSPTPGGTAGHYRDNRVHYFFSHVDELVAAGGVGAVFGTGAGNQTTITSDGGQFQQAVTGYLASPTPLP